MITEEREAQRTVLRLDSHIDLTDAEEMRRRLLEAIRRDRTPVSLDLSDAQPTVPVMQLLLAARETLASSGRFDGFGPNAAAALQGCVVGAPDPAFTSVRSAA